MKLRLALAMVMASGCAFGPPPGFSQGTTWTIPLVDPLADGRLVTSIYVEDKGPYLVAIDPDAPVSVLDAAIVSAGGFPAHPGGRPIDESDTSHPMFSATVTNLRIGDLSITQRTVLVAHHGMFDGDGRPILGVLGRDVISDSIVFGFDRDRGIAWLQTEDTFKTPTDATVLAYDKGTRARADLVTRRLVSANVDGHSVLLHLDLGAAPNQLLGQKALEAKLPVTPTRVALVDEFGGRREAHVAATANHVTAGAIGADHVAFVPYEDHRWEYGQIDGTLGLDFFRPYAVTADWHHERYFLSPRHDSADARAERLARWGEAIPTACRGVGCVHLAVETVEGKAVARVERDPAAAGKPLEVVVRANDGALPNLSVNLPPEVDHVDAEVDVAYAAAKLEVADASPFPFQCPGCVLTDPRR
jgi:hypothetical protein